LKNFNNPSIIFLNCQYILEMVQGTRVSLPRIIISLTTRKSSLLQQFINHLPQEYIPEMMQVTRVSLTRDAAAIPLKQMNFFLN
jgi:hypothetical protein